MKGQEADTSAFEQSLELMVVARVPDCLCDGFLLIAKYSMNFLTPASSNGLLYHDARDGQKGTQL
ncbi:hypothetical protein POX_a00412 [Penicillium oxalicum]|uniref:hypothetical protein n=1 Tax=Penicillium oxalicum TaxID=69781 RepID=UPI0020B8417C|nr:hypothetical protein POX_a00412 [Penicillium oxalicum]KAI2793825.1 hypothetical protein POX_a00412 [Penicillium oxalicum]